jgi:hypothetical protein
MSAAVALALFGCSKTRDTTVVTSDLIETRSDRIAASMEENWTDNEQSINWSGTEDLTTLRCFPNTDGSAIAAWESGDDGDEYLNFAFFPANGGAVANVAASGDFTSSAFSNAVDTMIVIWLLGRLQRHGRHQRASLRRLLPSRRGPEPLGLQRRSFWL